MESAGHRQLKYKYLWLMIGLGMVAFVVYASLTTSPVTPGFRYSDKFLHVVGYFGLMSWFMQIYHEKKHQYMLAGCFIAMGIGLEFLQDLGGVRVFEFADMVANTTGVLIAWVLSWTPVTLLLLKFESLFVK